MIIDIRLFQALLNLTKVIKLLNSLCIILDASVRSESSSTSLGKVPSSRARRRSRSGPEMAPPTPQTCSQPDCHYNTPVGVPDLAGVIQLLQIHAQMAHPPPAPPPNNGGDGGASSKGKLDKWPRPEVTTNMSEHEFKFF